MLLFPLGRAGCALLRITLLRLARVRPPLPLVLGLMLGDALLLLLRAGGDGDGWGSEGSRR